ncbi:hypothetical protein [Rhodococcus opacus]|uniref:hypothetical protein n=1 Tax=Rhodococcus opacus TaxID=37919 RepID=UPI001C496679|nr:hypothetical protein [Rhodococcus opacus]MBV6758355.1 hypothetical protein [Rhodococcus opacus]
MTVIHAPAGVKSAGIGFHVLFFVDGVAEDPGLNAGERAHWQGLGYRFVDDEHEDAEKTPARPARKRPAKAKTTEPVEVAPEVPETAAADVADEAVEDVPAGE